MNIDLINGDCLIELKKLPDNSVDSIVTDPPYELGFMGKKWDNTGIANSVPMWTECLRVLKPGGHLLAFSGTRTYHRMAVAIEDAGFEVRDMIEWVYGSGFPKSLNIGKAVDKLQGNEREMVGEQKLMGTARRMKGGNFNDFSGEDTADVVSLTKGTSEWEGWGTALKPAHEPICMARKPLSEKTVAENCLKWGTGGINIDESRVETSENTGRPHYDKEGFNCYGKYNDYVSETHAQGRFPANLIHDNSEDVRECFPESKSSDAIRRNNQSKNTGAENGASCYGKYNDCDTTGYSDSGNASRFFKSIIYQPKASKSERNKGCEGMPNIENANGDKWSDVDRRDGKIPVQRKNHHPTVKPVALMQYLIEMITKKDGVVMDMFMGSGTTGVACKNINRSFIGIEKEKEYYEIAKNRIYEKIQANS